MKKQLSKHVIRLIFSSFLVFHSVFSFAQKTAIIKGKVFTSDGKAAEFVNVSLKGTNKGVVADENGYYEIKEIKPGKYTVQASFVGLDS
ncbi:carboxypeptidase-like regulatory domain-containing protein [Arcicella rosea]|uniref:CarboxypepD_reg-like domain-containing protein n=1 Tax=Arcicella rosea TaxID=502909 RepID=A0A841EK22_9BACT|nr:carboxypeptidase-like regulatory domain-containing protein [Arcicella rosea]MBB6003535.1 hypothetical protein [Arcicella rosea]